MNAAVIIPVATLASSLIPGMIIWIMFGGFHTSSNTAAWACLELARHAWPCCRS